MYSIGTAARLAGVSTHTIRAWEKRYNLKVCTKDKNGHRRYSRAQVDHLILLVKLTQQGRKISDIAHLSVDALNSEALDNKFKKIIIDDPVILIKGLALESIVKNNIRSFDIFKILKLTDVLDEIKKPDLILVSDDEKKSGYIGDEIALISKLFPHSSIVLFAEEDKIEGVLGQNLRFLSCIASEPNRELVINILQEIKKQKHLYLFTLKKSEATLKKVRAHITRSDVSPRDLNKCINPIFQIEPEFIEILSEALSKLYDLRSYTILNKQYLSDIRLNQLIFDYVADAIELIEPLTSIAIESESLMASSDQ